MHSAIAYLNAFDANEINNRPARIFDYRERLRLDTNVERHCISNQTRTINSSILRNTELQMVNNSRSDFEKLLSSFSRMQPTHTTQAAAPAPESGKRTISE